MAWLAGCLVWLSLGLVLAFGLSDFSLYFVGFSFLFLLGVYALLSLCICFDLCWLPACIASLSCSFFDLIYFLYLIKKKEELICFIF